MASTSHLRAFQALEIAIRKGSLKLAADELCITPAAVGQRIKALEDYMGVDLVMRGRSGLKPTAELSKALPHLNRAFSELNAVADALDLQRADEICIAANSDWVELWLAPRLPEFQAAYPNVRFSINGRDDAPRRLVPSDVEVTFGAIRRQDNIDVLFHDYLAPISSPEVEMRIAKLRRKYKLEGFPLLHLDFYKDDPQAIDWPQWIKQYGHRRSAHNRGIRFQQITAGLEAVKSDAGFMICGLAMIGEEIKKGALTLPFSIDHGHLTGFAFQASYKLGASRKGHVRCFRKWLSAQAAGAQRELENYGPF